MEQNYKTNGTVQVYTRDYKAGDREQTLLPIPDNQKEFFEANGWIPSYWVTSVDYGVGKIQWPAMGHNDWEEFDSHHAETWYNGIDRLDGSMCEIEAVTDYGSSCFWYNDEHTPAEIYKQLLYDGDTHELLYKGWLYVAKGSVSVDGNTFEEKTILEVKNINKTLTASGHTILLFLGE